MSGFLWTTLPTFETERLLLRAMTAEDAVDLFALCGDADVMRYASDPPFPDETYAGRMLESVSRLFAAREAVEWGIEAKSSGQLIGTCGVHSFNPERRTAQIGCLLAVRCWKQGLMQEALRPVILFAEQELRLGGLIAEIDPPNTRSIQLFTRLGFRRIDAASFRLPLSPDF